MLPRLTGLNEHFLKVLPCNVAAAAMSADAVAAMTGEMQRAVAWLRSVMSCASLA